MSISDWISIICSGIALIVTVIIAVLQIKQSDRMEKFEKRQDERDEQRHCESVKVQALSFISKHYDNRGLIPLCAISAMYNDRYLYTREMYHEFCCFTKEVQNKILDLCEIDLQVRENDNFFFECVKSVENIVESTFKKEESIFYDGGKYIERCLTYYGKEKLPHTEFKYENDIANIIVSAFQNNECEDKNPISELSQKFNFRSCDERNACQLATVTAKYIAIFAPNANQTDKDYGTPGGYSGETIDIMEDLFLQALFEIYTNLILIN